MTEAYKLLEGLRNNKYAPVYFLQGEEPYYIDLISEHIENNALDETAKGFNQVVIYGKDVRMADLLQHARRFPMMSDRQVVIVKEAQNILDFGKEDAQTMFESYLKNPLPSTILVLCYKHKTFDKRKKIYKALQKQAVVLDSKKLYDNKLPSWIRDYLKSKNYQISEKAQHMLAEYIGNNLTRLANEIDKMLVNFSQPDSKEGENEASIKEEQPQTITEDHIQKYVGISKEYNAFELQRAILVKDMPKAGRIVQYFEANPKNSPILPVIGVLYAAFSKLMTLHHLGAESDQKIAQTLRINPFFVNEYRTGLRNYALKKVIDNIHHLNKADLMSKGVFNANVSSGQVLKELVYKLMH